MQSIDLLIRKLEVRDTLGPSEHAALRSAAGPAERYPAGASIVREGQPQTTSRLLAKGYVARAKVLPDGSRQITALHIAGDFVDLHSFVLKRLDHDIVALTPVDVVAYAHQDLKRITETEPHLTRMLWLSTLMDGAIHREWLASAGRRSAIQQIAGLFCEMVMRHRLVGLTDDWSIHFPLTQIDLADVCGLSPVHVNRVVQELRETRLVQWQARKLTLLDFDRLAELARFDPAFLVLNREPR